MRTPWLYRLTILTLAIAGCTRFNVPRTAEFRERADSVRKADLRGPFNGKIVSQGSTPDTTQPVADALVYATWSFVSGAGLSQRSGFKQFVGKSDSLGHYWVPLIGKLSASPISLPSGARLIDFTLLVYKRGFVAYRSDHRFSDLSRRFDFVQQDHTIKLRPWTTTDSHTNHVRFIGGGPALTKLTQWEFVEAAAELAGDQDSRLPEPATPDTVVLIGSAIIAAQLLTVSEIRSVTGYKGEFTTSPLANRPNTETYSSQHFRAQHQHQHQHQHQQEQQLETDSQGFDVAVRMWKLGLNESAAHYESTLQRVPGANATDEIASKSFRASDAGVLGLGFWDQSRHIFVLVTCGNKQCVSQDIVATLAKLIYAKVTSKWPLLE